MTYAPRIRCDSEIEGQLERITYYNEENDYTIARLKVKGRRDLVTIVGHLASVNPGEVLKIKGTWDMHTKFGEQFKVATYESIIPATVAGMEKYLGSGLIKGIGPVLARRLTARFALETFDIIEQAVERLKEVDGIGEKRVDMIRTAWQEQREIKEIMLFLQHHGISCTYATKIFKFYGDKAIAVVKENPYRLAMDIFGIGFITADKIAEKLGFTKDSPIRAEAGIIYVLSRMADDGHVYYPYDLLIEKCREILEQEGQTIASAMDTVAGDKKIVIETLAGSGDVKDHDQGVYLSTFYVSEKGIATNLRKLAAAPRHLRQFDHDKALEWTQQELSITLAERQGEAVRASFTNKVMVITGGPGTGKTTIIKCIIGIHHRLGSKVLLAAPTGRAAKRMAESTGHEAKTLHRLLEFSPKESGFKKNDTNPLAAGLVIVDEASMIDTVLMHHFLKAVPLDATLILVGDVDQLPSVGPGNVLKDIIDSGLITTVRLTEIFRQSRQSLIVVNAHRINQGLMPLFTLDIPQSQDFYFIDIEEPEKIVEKIIYLCKERIPEKLGMDSMKDIQVLSSMNKGVIGVANLNAALQNALNPSDNTLIRGGKILKIGDKVMQVVNNYDKDVYNGDMGRIAKFNRELQEVAVDFEGKTVVYDYKDLDEIVTAYAVSIHKSQGSEYPAIVMPLHTQHYLMLQRNLLYTGITRGRKLVIVVGTKKALAIAVKNNTPRKRYTHLTWRLRS